MTVAGRKIKEVRDFKYCGGIVTVDGRMGKEISRRLAAAGETFWKLKKGVFGSTEVTLKVKIRVYVASVIVVLLYGGETWNVHAEEIRRLEVFHTNCMRCMLGKSKRDHITNVEIRRMMGMERIEGMLMERRLRWLGHVARMEEGRIPKRMLFGRLEGATRAQSKPLKRWKDVVRGDMRSVGIEDRWYGMVGERNEWRAKVRAMVEKWGEEREKEEMEDRERRRRNDGRGSGGEVSGVTCGGCGAMMKSEGGLKRHYRSCTGSAAGGETTTTTTTSATARRTRSTLDTQPSLR